MEKERMKQQKYEVALIDVGRDNRCTTFHTTRQENVGEQIIEKAKFYLLSDNVWIAEAQESTAELGVFNINAGFHTVGKATIKEI